MRPFYCRLVRFSGADLATNIRPTLCCQRRHVLVRSSVNLVSVGVNRQHQHHDAPHDAPGHWPHGGALDHV